MAFSAHLGMVGIGGAGSVRAVREDEVEARLVVEAERRNSERRMVPFRLSLSVSLVARDEVETADRRLVKLRKRLPSSGSSLPSLSPEEEESEDLTGAITIPVERVEAEDGKEAEFDS